MADYAWIRLARRAAGLHKFHQVGKNKALQSVLGMSLEQLP